MADIVVCKNCRRPVEIDNLNGKPHDHKEYCLGTTTCIQRVRYYEENQNLTDTIPLKPY